MLQEMAAHQFAKYSKDSPVQLLAQLVFQYVEIH